MKLNVTKVLGALTALAAAAAIAEQAASAPHAVHLGTGGVLFASLMALLVSVGALPGQKTRNSDRMSRTAVAVLSCEVAGLLTLAAILFVQGRTFGGGASLGAALGVGAALAIVLTHRRRYLNLGVRATEEYMHRHDQVD